MQVFINFEDETISLTGTADTKKATLEAEAKRAFHALRQSVVDFKYTDPIDDIALVIRTESGWQSAVAIALKAQEERMRLKAVKNTQSLPPAPTKQGSLTFAKPDAPTNKRNRSPDRYARSPSPERKSKKAKDKDKDRESGKEKSKETKDSKDSDKDSKDSKEDSGDVVMRPARVWTPSASVKGLVKIDWTSEDAEKLNDIASRLATETSKPKLPQEAKTTLLEAALVTCFRFCFVCADCFR